MKRLRDILMLLTAFWLLFSCSEDKGQMLRQLEMLEEANRADSVMNNDSLAEDLVAYFDKHGTPNERMRARYILGRTYADLGETPKAISMYNDAEACVDTSDSNCDFKILSRIHGQKAAIFRKQYLPQEAAVEFDAAMSCATKSGDSTSAMFYQENKLITYYQLNQYDSLLYYTDKVFYNYIRFGHYGNAANCLGASIFVLLEQHDLVKAKQYIDFYERYCDIDADSCNRLASLYAYKGYYHLEDSKNDSAIFYFKKQLKYKEVLINRIQAYHGLFRAYYHKNQKDSAAKYAELYSIANDSSNVFDSANRLQALQSMYKYERSQKEASLSKENAEKNKRKMWWAIGLSLVVLLGVIRFFRRKLAEEKSEMVKLNQKYKSTLESYNKAKQDKSLAEQEKTAFILKKEHEIKEYKRILQKYESFSRESDEQEQALSENPLLKKLHNEASIGHAITDNDLIDVFSLIERNYPNFLEELSHLSTRLTHKQKSLCALTKLYFIPSEIGSLLNMRYQSVTNMRSRLAKSLFGEDCETEMFDTKIHAIC